MGRANVVLVACTAVLVVVFLAFWLVATDMSSDIDTLCDYYGRTEDRTKPIDQQAADICRPYLTGER